MNRFFDLVEVDQRDGILCVPLRPDRIDELELSVLTGELIALGTSNNCRRLILCFGQKAVECLYSVFLAKLISVQRQLAAHNCLFILCEIHPVIRNVFQACHLEEHFLFAGSVEEALALQPGPPFGQGSRPCRNPHCVEIPLSEN